MKKMQWLQLIALNLLVGLCIFLPFLPGPYDKLVLGLSSIAQLIGYLGLILVPIGIFWLIQEIKKITGANTSINNWSNGYYFALTSLFICIMFCLFLALVLLFSVGLTAVVIWLSLISIGLYKIVPVIRRLKKGPVKTFNAAPLYLLSLPIIGFALRSFFISPVSEFGRNYAIEKGQEVISSIETYYEQYGNYPESLEYVHHVPKPFVMGIDEFHYEKNGEAYNLSFVQWQHVGATREVVMYNKNDQHNVKGHFASYNTRKAHWKYYWLD
jgi:hypothetical protein